MANDINVVVLVGRLTKDAEIKVTTGGTSVARFSLAVNRRKKNGETWVDEVNFFDCAFWGTRADNMKTYLTKGRQVSISGELRQNRWEQDGQSRSKVEVFVNDLQLLSSSTEGSAKTASPAPANGNAKPASPAPAAGSPKSTPAPAGTQAAAGPESFQDNEEDIPF